MDLFLREFQDKNKAELLWLRAVYECVGGLAGPGVSCPTEHSVGELALGVIRALQQTVGSSSNTLPLSYRPISVSELVRRQHVPCCSHLTWSSGQYREWATEAEQLQTGDAALARDNLLLIGYVTDRENEMLACDGIMRVKDKNASVHCKMITPSPVWLNQFMLFPSWSFIPHMTSLPNQGTKGHLEISGSPIPLVFHVSTPSPQGTCTHLMGVGEAARYLQQRQRYRGVRLQVCGNVAAVCPQLEISGKRFFFFCLREGDSSVPIMVPDSGHVCWEPCLYVGDHVCVSGLRVCTLRAWENRRVLCVTPESHLQSHQEPQDTKSPGMETCVQLERRTGPHSTEEHLHTHSTVRRRTSKIVNYKGILTRVLDAEWGLFELDGKVGLCVAYQPLQERAFEFRPGAQIEVHNAHFLYRPSSHAPAALLCMCLRSSLRIVAFSCVQSQPVAGPCPATPLLRILLQNHLGISQYLWLCHCVTVLKEKLCPRWVRLEHITAVAGRMLNCLPSPRPHGWGCRRDIYREMLQEPHNCPLSQYSESAPQVKLLSLEQLCLWMESESWSLLSLPSLLPPSAPHLTRADLNPLLSWSVVSQTAWSLPTPLVVIGMLEVCAKTGCLQLRDQTGSVDLVAVERRAGSYRAISNTALLRCLVCVQRFTLVMERLLHTDFPSWTHLDQDHITHRHCRVYIQLCMDDLQVLSPWNATISFRGALQQEAVEACNCGPDTDGRGGDGGSRDRKSMGGNSPDEGDREQPKASTTTGGCRQDKKQRTRQQEGGVPIPAKKPRKAEHWSNVGGKEDLIVEAVGQGQDHSCPRPQRSQETVQQTSEVAGPSTCLSVVFYLQSKDGLTFQNVHTAAAQPGQSLCFFMSVLMLGDVQQWEQNPRNSMLEPRESAGGTMEQVDMHFVGRSICWFPLLQPGCVYRMVAPHTENPTVLHGTQVSMKHGIMVHGTPSLVIQPQWRFYTLPSSPELTMLLQEKQPKGPAVLSVTEVLYSSTVPDLVSFKGLIAQRMHLQDNGKTMGLYKKQGLNALCVNVRLTVQDLASPGQWIHVYLDLSQRPYVPGLIPGAEVVFSAFQRVVSRVCNAVMSNVQLSCELMCFLCRPGPPGPPPPAVLLGNWAQGGAQQCIVARVRIHVVLLLSLQLRWTCTLCGSIFKQDSCTRNSGCSSHTAVFQAEAKAVVEDGSGEAQVWFPSHLIVALLALGAAEWEGLQRSVRVRGHIRVHQGRNAVDAGDLDDPLLQYLSCLCVCAAVCRPLSLSCQLKQNAMHMQDGTIQLKRFQRGDREFVTRVPPPLQLTCTALSEWEPSETQPS
ncbi:CST complex subunit CTC1 isoform X1 [Arapaima gigas]